MYGTGGSSCTLLGNLHAQLVSEVPVQQCTQHGEKQEELEIYVWSEIHDLVANYGDVMRQLT